MKPSPKVNIRPNVTILSVLKFLEYETWFALAEFVDNAIASYQTYEDQLRKAEGSSYLLRVSIELDDAANKITIRDNAAGIDESNYSRAFRAAEVPRDASGLSEFGMGMKSAACWFADKWCVTTTALGENVEKKVFFDMNKIIEDKLEELDVQVKACDENYHYTVIELFNVHRMPRRRGISKVKDHLKSIYRDFFRRKILSLKVEDEVLSYSDPKILNVAKFDDPKGVSIEWKKEIAFEIEQGLSVHGFVAIREKASTSEAGFALFRRGRVIEGSFDEGFRPEFIFGAPNSYRYQRVFGELHLEGFDVNFTKKGIQWDENLDAFLKILKDDLNHKTFPLLQQAEQYRVRATEKEYKGAKRALDQTANDLEKKAPNAVEATMDSAASRPEIDKSQLTPTEKTLNREFEIRFNKIDWKIYIELSYDPSLKELVEIGDRFIKDKSGDSTVRHIGIRLSLTHSFMVEFAGVDNSRIEPILRMAAALGLAEVIAKGSGVKTQGEVRRNFNELISNLSEQG
jgi:hypothetical protein